MSMLSIIRSARKLIPVIGCQVNVNIVQQCGYKKHVPEVLKEMKSRRKKVGPEPLRHRSVWLDWNYDTELYAFANRLGEKWNAETLRKAFIEQSYLEQEEKRRQELGISSEQSSVALTPNTQLSRAGEDQCHRYITSYLAQTLPKVPKECIESVCNYLMSDDVLSHVSKNIGTADLIMCADFPPEKSTLSNVLKALIGCLIEDCGSRQADLFIQDFLLTQLVGKDIFELWEIPYPEQTLASILHEQGREPAEPRLLWEAGRNTLEAGYNVALYSNKKLIGASVGETLEIAQEMASRDALRRMYGLVGNMQNFPFGKMGRQVQISAQPELAATASKAA
ncbi:large ribosomal subunit protein mL44-like [Ornithodoros turicata]|uniref:large ribosomal subunit protein mL44-like n=1 Tax=Ornithodoros turicata TaxID=34597 RepID=UPI0031393C34